MFNEHELQVSLILAFAVLLLTGIPFVVSTSRAFL